MSRWGVQAYYMVDMLGVKIRIQNVVVTVAYEGAEFDLERLARTLNGTSPRHDPPSPLPSRTVAKSTGRKLAPIAKCRLRMLVLQLVWGAKITLSSTA